MQIIESLGKNVRATSRRGVWSARCPVHNDKDFAMTIRENKKGGLNITCHACGANGVDVYRNLGIPLGELFGDHSDLPKGYVTMRIREIYSDDQFFMAVFRADIASGVKPTSEEAKRMRMAVKRSKTLEGKYPSIKKSIH